MTPVIILSELARSVFSLWAFLLCLIGIFSIILAVTQKLYYHIITALVPFLLSYLVWQVLFDIQLFGTTKNYADLSLKLGAYPRIYLLLFLTVLTFTAMLILVVVVRNSRLKVTPNAIKLCLDKMPCGVCLWNDSGKVFFSNICINRLCIDITGSPLLNGNTFYDAVKDGIVTVAEKRWHFSCRDIIFGGERLHELIASDISAEYAKTQALEMDKSELSRINRELKEYNLGISDTVRRAEILQAKVNIHDEMNRLMLSTVAADGDDTAALDTIFTLWGQNALLLCMEADKSADNNAATLRIENLAEALKIQLIWPEQLPEGLSERQTGLFFSAAQEAITNAAKHARAKFMEISFEQSDAGLLCIFKNDGDVPSGNVCFSGGLYNLSELAVRQDASVSVSVGKTFDLILRFNNQPDG
ncbi:MAG: hypothetical protein J5659_07375 [Clostridia bacterium]|nr:hypothetical protein [Clostridia bacterium]